MPWQNWGDEMIGNLSPELAITIGVAALALVAVAWVLVRWGKAIMRFLLLLAGLAIAALTMMRQAAATREVARAAAVGQTVSSAGTFLLLGALAVVVILAALAVGYFWLRWKLVEAHGVDGRRPAHRRRQRLPQPVVCVLEQDLDDLITVPSGEWTGNWEDDVWMSDELPF
jgi:hypothetical protein